MDTFGNKSLSEVAGIEVEAVEDYATTVGKAGGLKSKNNLPFSNELKYF
ncbi:hypothetical protein [Bacillus sp. OTU2372]